MTPRKAGPETLGEYRLHPDLIPNLAPIDSAKPHPGNAKVGNVEEIRASMRTNGIYRPVIVQKSSGYIVAGRHTWQAIKDGGGEQAPIVWLDVNDEEASRIRLADNRTADLGGYDDRLLLEALAELDHLDGTGYDEDYLAKLEAALVTQDEDLTPGEFPEYGQDIETHYGCPSCGYAWSGNPNPGRPTHVPDDAEDEA